MTNEIKILSSLGLMLAFGQVFAGAITDISVDNPSATERVVKITFDGPAPNPSSFATANPPRIALDFANTTVSMSQPQKMLNDSVVKMTMAAESNNRARVLLGLAENANYTTKVQGNTLLVQVNNKATDIAYNETPAQKVDMNAQVVTSNVPTRDAMVDFRRSEKGAGRLELTLPVKNAPADVTRVGDRVVITLVGNRFSGAQLRKFDVNDFATPAKKVDVFNDGRNGKVVINTKGNWDYASFQTQDKLVVEVSEKLVKSDGKSVIGGDKFVGKKLSLNFQDIEIRTVLQVIAEFTDMNIVVSDKVAGNMTLKLTDVPWDQALKLILDSKNLKDSKDGNVIRIETMEEYDGRVAALNNIEKNMQIEQRIFKLKYKDVETFKQVLKLDEGSTDTNGYRRTILSPRGSALIDPGTNTLVINDVKPVIQKLEELVELLDVAKKQVMIEARIVEAKDEFTRQFGVKFGGARVGKTSFGNNWDAASTNNRGLGSGKINVSPNISLPVATDGAGGVFGIFHSWSSYAIGLEISASQMESTSRIVSTPRILTADREEGMIKDGTDIPYQEASSSGATSTSFKTASTSLTVTPQITPDGNIIMDVEVKKDTPSSTLTSSGELAIDVRQIKTKATVENGGTVVIGGIYTQTEEHSSSKVPFLGDIPILGNLFKKKVNKNDRRELLVFLTPRILADIDAQARY